jgi:tetratricopeptide (TPR) repeat protein
VVAAVKTILLCSIALLASISLAQNSNLQRGDMHYELRAKDASGNMANNKNIKEAIKYYRLALADSKTKETATWKLLRAYYFLGCFTELNFKDRQDIFEKARSEGKNFLKEYPKNVEVAYWYSVNLALWASVINPLVVLNTGSIRETRDIANMLIVQEDNNKTAAAHGYQILGRVHQKLPHIAFILSWVNKDSSEIYFKKSLELNSKDLGTHLFLAEHYMESGKKQKAQELLQPIIKTKPRTEEFLEDERNLIKMRNLLNLH